VQKKIQEEIKKRIEEVKEMKSEKLYLSNLELVEIPKEVFDLKFLKILDLSNNKLTSIPSEIESLHLMKNLILSNNELTSIPDEIVNLKELTNLHLTNNKLFELPENIKALRGLSRLFLDNNKFKNIPKSFLEPRKIRHIDLDPSPTWQNNTIFLGSNPLENPPPQILNQGIDTTLNYYAQQETQGTLPLYESKIILVGEPDAGKTSLMKKLINHTYEIPQEEKSTLGVEIKSGWSFTSTKDPEIKMRANLWDFGGQQIQYMAHQFFLTPRALYLLVVDDRRELVNIDYWFNVIHLLGEGSPVLVVQNQKNYKSTSNFDLDINSYKERYKNDFYIENWTIDLSENDYRFKNFCHRLYELISNLDHIGVMLPSQWVNIRKKIEEIQYRNHISIEEYFEICIANGLKDQKDQLVLSSYLHALGVMLHFQNSEIQDFVILNPKWAMDAVYSVLSNKYIIEENGIFSRYWFNEYLGDKGYDQREQARLLDLMKKNTFEICYQLSTKNGDEFIAPQLLKKSKPNIEDILKKLKNVRRLRYVYNFMPKGIISRLIVRLSEYIYTVSDNKGLIWQKGGVFKYPNNSIAIIEEVITKAGQKVIDICVGGLKDSITTEFLLIIKKEVEEIHRKSFKWINADLMVPCICSQCEKQTTPHYFRVKKLKERVDSNKRTVECGEYAPFDEVPISKLISNIEIVNVKRKKPIKKLFISYAHKDKKYKDELNTHLKSLIRLQKIEVWDDKEIDAGADWKYKIFKNLSEADIILLLISPDFINSEFCYTKELDFALKQQVDGESTIIPVIIRDCIWTDLPFGNFQALPKNGKAINSWKNRDKAYKDVVKKIKKIIS